MKADLNARLRCPASECQGRLDVVARAVKTLHYRSGPVEEVEEGELRCSECRRAYPIAGYVPSFERLFPAELREEADYWSKWYGFMWERGYLGFFDLRVPMAPFITEGVEALDPSTLDHNDLRGSHFALIEHPLIREAGHVLDVGCGTGWSSLFLARRGHEVVAFDPSLANMRLAKRYAISQGEYIEYIAAGLGYLSFELASFDAIVALHSIHHVPALKEKMADMREWLRDGGGIGIDEHLGDHPVLGSLAAKMRVWAEDEVYPKARTLGPEFLRDLPAAGHSSLEGSGSKEVISAFVENFEVETFSSRYVSLDPFSFIYFLSRDLDVRAYHYGGDVLEHIYKFMGEAFPEDAEYVTLVGKKSERTGRDQSELAMQAWRLGERSANNRKEDDTLAARARVIVLQRALDDVNEQLEHATQAVATQAEAIASMRQDIQRLNELLHAKDEHIERLEGLVRRQQGELELKEREKRRKASSGIGGRMRRMAGRLRGKR
jgi:2-polyprenyl-3-methyl-5-hydroxy-6-metoxy-1,4-benzoquinol methylase